MRLGLCQLYYPAVIRLPTSHPHGSNTLRRREKPSLRLCAPAVHKTSRCSSTAGQPTKTRRAAAPLREPISAPSRPAVHKTSRCSSTSGPTHQNTSRRRAVARTHLCAFAPPRFKPHSTLKIRKSYQWQNRLYAEPLNPYHKSMLCNYLLNILLFSVYWLRY